MPWRQTERPIETKFKIMFVLNAAVKQNKYENR
jgi:hypothetical protein